MGGVGGHRRGQQRSIELRLSASEFLDRIAALIPPPRKHRHRYFGVLAPNSPWRALVTVVPWHQDSGFFGQISDRSCILTCWIPLVVVDAGDGCLQILPGYHKGPLLNHREEDRDGKFLEVDPSLLDESKAITCPMQPGNVLVFSKLSMHRSLPSTSPNIRWSIDIRYLCDGDHPGTLQWPNEGDRWIVKSLTRPPTSYAQWQRMTADLTW